MVRFIIKNSIKCAKKGCYIYIPLWLDLLSLYKTSINFGMEIYIPLWLDLLLHVPKSLRVKDYYLHSTMVRFIIDGVDYARNIQKRFTFHYG